MRWLLCSFMVVLLSGCLSLEQRYETVRKEERVLFEGVAHVGDVSNSGELIFWEQSNPVQVIVSDRNFYHGSSIVAFSHIKGAAVGAYRSEQFIFTKAETFEDLLILDLGYKSTRVFLFVPASRKFKDPLGGPEQRALAEAACDVIEKRRASTDVFGLPQGPSLIGVANWPGPAYAYWGRTPLYMKERYSEGKKQIEGLFKSARSPISESFDEGARTKVVKILQDGSDYSFQDLGFLRLDWTSHGRVKNRLGERAKGMDRVLVLDTPRFALEEKLDPYGNPSVKVSISNSLRFYDISQSRLSSWKSYQYEATHTLAEWLEGGVGLIESEVERATENLAQELLLTLN